MKTTNYITELQVRFMKANNGLVGFASLVIDGRWYLGNLAVYVRLDGDGYRIVYPTKRLQDGQEIPIFHPINSDAGQLIEKAVTDKIIELHG